MPKSAARIWLKVTNVRRERLQDISDDDARAEGYKESPSIKNPYFWFRNLWGNIYGFESWRENLWVWVVEFERVER